MGFLSGRMTFERFQVQGKSPRQFGQEHIQQLEKYAIGQIESATLEAPSTGFIAGKHLFDLKFDLEKNVILDTLHAALRIDTAKVPGPLKKAWFEMELALLAAENSSGRPTRAQKQQAKEAVQARCEEEIKAGHFRRMQQVPFLWNTSQEIVYCGSSNTNSQEHLRGLFETAFSVELKRITAGTLAMQLAAEQHWMTALNNVSPSSFSPSQETSHVAWLTDQPDSVDYLGNEFLLWLWWWLETQGESIELPDETEVTGMLNKTLSLECPRGESGRETISAEAPTRLPEALHAVRSGKLPRKMGITLVREGEQYDFVLQAESLSLNGAAIQADGDDRGRGALEERVTSIRRLSETIDLVYTAFLGRRLGRQWDADLTAMQTWLESESRKSVRRAG